MKFITAIILAAFATTPTLIAQTIHTLSLDDAIALARSASPEIERENDRAAAAEAHWRAAKSEEYPKVDASASYARVSPVSSATFGPTVFQLNPANNYDGHIDVDAVLYDFDRRTAGIDLAGAEVPAARDRKQLTEFELSYRTAGSFYTILFLRQSIVVTDREIASLREHRAMTEKKVASGTATDLDILTVQVRLNAALRRRVDQASALAKEEIRLKEAANIPAGDSLILAGAFDSTVVLPPMSDAEARASTERIEFRSAEHSIDEAVLRQRLASIGDRPVVRFHAAYGVKNGLFPNIDAWRGNYVAGLQVSVPIFDGFKTEYLADEAAAGVNAATQEKARVERQIRTEIQLAEENVRAARQNVAVAKMNADQAQKALNIARIRYEAGAVTNLDLLDAETSLAEAQFQTVEAMYRLTVRHYGLMKAMGETIVGIK